jgi:hypothetical protein
MSVHVKYFRAEPGRQYYPTQTSPFLDLTIIPEFSLETF